MAKVKLYGTPTCPYCTRAKQMLENEGIEFENADVSSDEAAMQEMLDKTGQMSVPVLDIDGEIVVGFDKNKISELLGI